RSCILLWMNGGPSQMDTFDLKPGTPNGGPYTEIETNAPGLKISQHLPKLAGWGDQLAVIRSMSTKEGDHGRATFLMRTGYLPQGPIQYPCLGSLLAKELGQDEAALPSFVSIAPVRFLSAGAFGPGFLGPQYAPLVVGNGGPVVRGGDPTATLRVEDLDLPDRITREQADSRLDLLQIMEKDFNERHPGVSPRSHETAYERAVRLMRSEASKAFNLDEEKPALRDAYGRSQFGQGCLLARRLVERGVPFVEVTLGPGTDTPGGADT